MVLSKEEEKAKKEALKLEMLEAEEKAYTQQKKDELRREIAMHSVSRKELDKKWREVMVRIKEPLYHKNVEVLRHTFERALDKKEHLIDLMMHLKHVADDQHQRTVCNCCDIIDKMINNFLVELEAIGKQNDIKTTKLLKQGENEINSVSKDSKNAETHLKLLLYNAHETDESLTWTMRGENMVKKDEDTNKYFDTREDLRSCLENSYNAMWDHYIETLKAYVVRNSENQRHVRKLRRKQNTIEDIIAAQAKKMISNEAVIERLRAELASYESGSKQVSSRALRMRHRSACNRLKTSLHNGIDTDVKRLTTLVKASDESLDWLDAALKKGEKILRIAALCRKYETCREKILPYVSTMPSYTLTQAKPSTQLKCSDDCMIVNEMSLTFPLTRLWKRIAKAELSKKALHREKMLLEYENAAMMRQLEDRDEEKINLDGYKCHCVQKSSKRLILSQPRAVLMEVWKLKK